MSAGSSGCRLDELSQQIDARLIGDGDVVVARVRLPEEAGPGDLAFAPHPRFLRGVEQTRASALLCDLAFAADHAHELPCAVLAADNPPLALAKAFHVLHPSAPEVPSIDERAAVDPQAELGDRVAIGPFAVVRRARLGAEVRVASHAFIDDEVTLGPGTQVGPGAVILAGTTLGARCVVHPGAIVGDAGFRYAADGERNVRVPQPAAVVIEDDVEIGANATVDRGDVRDTFIGEGSRIDNHVQVGHGVQMGRHGVLVGHTAVGGDSVLGDRVVLAGQVGVVPYVTIGDDARIGGKSGVTRDVPARAARSGIPAIDHVAWLKNSARARGRLSRGRSADAATDVTPDEATDAGETASHDVVQRLKTAEDQLQALQRRLSDLERRDPER